ncbi:putative Carboxylic ester hydrolase [Seiridium unicorne]|uniref:Carboxylic ester hydrolase n=1 Tax=Seiridium unicorne TaxID=138068 RepID=A0ABR2UGA6_9PEZI
MRFTSILSAAALALSSVEATCNSTGPVVKTGLGTVLGVEDAEYPGVRQFLGIPYGQNPTGSLRFMPPKPAGNFNYVEATEIPPSCMQFLNPASATIYTRDVLQFNLGGLNETGNVAEDCLKLSVWTPSEASLEKSGKVPVLIFIFGGGLQTGGIDVPYQIPTQWVQRSQDHIVVTFNYRVNIFGFPNSAGSPDVNVGYLDQRLAIEWVRDNIAAFGGDPDNMLLFGQSAGSVSTDVYSFAYPDDPIVKAVIMESLTAHCPVYSHDYAQSNFSFVANALGCGGLNATGELSCMQHQVSAETIRDFVANRSIAGTTPSLTFTNIADEKVYFSNYTERALLGKVANIPAIVGTNTGDGLGAAPYAASGANVTYANEHYLSTFLCPSTTTITDRIAAGVKAYRYSYNGNFSNISPRGWEGAYHSAELPMVFGTHPNYRGNSTEFEYATSHAMQDAWVAFAKGGADAMAEMGWPIYEPGTVTAQEIGTEPYPMQLQSLADAEAMC